MRMLWDGTQALLKLWPFLSLHFATEGNQTGQAWFALAVFPSNYMFSICPSAATHYISSSTWDSQGEHQEHQAPLHLYFLSALSLLDLGESIHIGEDHIPLWPKEHNSYTRWTLEAVGR